MGGTTARRRGAIQLDKYTSTKSSDGFAAAFAGMLAFTVSCSFSLHLQLLARPQIVALQTHNPQTKFRDLLKRIVAVLPRGKLASGLQ
jgi:hypothetical protein